MTRHQITWFSGLRGKLLLLVALPTLVLALVAGTGIYAFRSQNNDLVQIANNRMPKTITVGHLRMNNHAVIRLLLQALLEKSDPAKRTKILETAENRIQQLSDDLASMDKFKHTELFKQTFAPTYDKWKALEPALQNTVALLKQNSVSGDQEAHQLLEGNVAQISGDLVTILADSEKNAIDTTQSMVKAAENESDRLFTAIVVVSLLGAASFILFGLIFASRLANGLTQIAQILSRGADDVASASAQIASSSEELSSSVTEQAAALQETSAAVEELSTTVAKNSESCSKSKKIATQSHNSATQGQTVVSEMIQAIQEIHQSNTEIMKEIDDSNQEISEIVQVIAEIGNKTKVINDIVFQTKLLSFNASVEAARAGEHGKGFAVVAEEVGNLAQMSGNAAKEISGLLEGSIVKVETIVKNTKTKVERLVGTGKQKVEQGRSVAKRCGEVSEPTERSKKSLPPPRNRQMEFKKSQRQ
jgi:methyl-accepting chemotaxis protein